MSITRIRLGQGMVIKSTGHSKRIPFVLVIPSKIRRATFKNSTNIVALPPAKMRVRSVVFRSFVKFLLLFYDGTLN